MSHLMVDIETLGTNSNSPVIEIGVVKFNDEDIVDKFSSYVKPDFSVSKPDVSTLAFWAKQDIKLPLREDAPPFPLVLSQLAGWLGSTYIDGVWANAPSFDLVILFNLATAYGLEMPWHWRQFRDMRTLKVIGKRLEVEWEKADIPHVAVEDAVAQARYVIAVNRALARKGARVL